MFKKSKAIVAVTMVAAMLASTCSAATYTVKKGDTLWALSRKYDVTIQEIVDANPAIKDPNLIYVDQKLEIPEKEAETTEPETPEAELGQIKFVLAGESDSAEAFVCAVSENGTIYWKAGLDTFDEVFAGFGLTDDGTYIKASVVADNDETYQYLYPEKDWKGLVFGETLPGNAVLAKISDAFEQWKSEVYSQFDYIGLRELSAQDWIDAAPAEGYEVTDKDIEALRLFVAVEDGLISYARDSVRYTVAKYCGTAIKSDLVSCANALYKQTNNIISSDMQSEMGVMARGVTGQNFIHCVVGSYFYFDADQWLNCNIDSGGYVYAGADTLFQNGLYAWRDDSTNNWYLSTSTGEVVYCINDSEIGPGQAFSCLVDENGTVYWASALDSAVALEQYFADEISGDYICVHLKPELEEEDALYLLADGKDPSLYHKYVYFDPNSDWTNLTVDNGGELPTWWNEACAEKVFAAFDEWYADIYENIDFAAVRQIFEVPEEIEVSDEDVDLLRDWAVKWQEFTDAGVSPAAQIKLAAIDRFGVSVWNDLVEYVTAYWRTKHTACTGMAISAGYLEYKEVSSSPLKDTVSGSVLDTQTAFTVAYLSDVDWGFAEGEANAYLSVAKLVSHGLVPSTDGEAWYLTDANTASIVYEISLTELFAD